MTTFAIVMGIIALILGPMLFYCFNGMWGIRRLIVKDVDGSKLADGVYLGAYHKTRWVYDVQVSVKGGRIVGVKNVNPLMEKRSPRTNVKIAAAILEAQTPRIP